MRYRDGIEYAWTTEEKQPEPGQAVILRPPDGDPDIWTVSQVVVDETRMHVIWERYITAEPYEPQPGQDTAQ